MGFTADFFDEFKKPLLSNARAAAFFVFMDLR
jgi:hypothetical protein